jgi:hypothetical protein
MMTDDMISICERWEKKGFDSGFRIGVGLAFGVVLAVALVGWVLK